LRLFAAILNLTTEIFAVWGKTFSPPRRQNTKIIGERLNALDEPLLDAAMEIQLETEASDLWFREFIQGNMVVDLKTIWQPLEHSVWYLHTILQSNKIRKKFYSPLKDDETHELIKGVQQKLAANVQSDQKRNFDGIPSATKTPRHQDYSEIYSFHIQKSSNDRQYSFL